MIRYLGADPVLVDIDPDTFNIDPVEVKKAITPKTKAIIPVHFAGLACDMSAILKVAKKHNLKVIEDAAHAIPTTSGGQLIGSLQSDAAVYSFYATKTLTTGEGGMVVTRDPEVAARCRVMRLHGISRDAFDRYSSKTPSWYYEVVAPGFKYNMTDIASSLGIHQLKKVYSFQKRRSEIAPVYDQDFRWSGSLQTTHDSCCSTTGTKNQQSLSCYLNTVVGLQIGQQARTIGIVGEPAR